MNTHQMSLRPEPFNKIKSGKKTIEIRLFDEKRQKLKVEDNIVFTNTETNERIHTKIVDLNQFKNFVEMFSKIKGNDAGWSEDDTPEKMSDDMRKYYSEEDEEKYGVLGIKVEINEN